MPKGRTHAPNLGDLYHTLSRLSVRQLILEGDTLHEDALSGIKALDGLNMLTKVSRSRTSLLCAALATGRPALMHAAVEAVARFGHETLAHHVFVPPFVQMHPEDVPLMLHHWNLLFPTGGILAQSNWFTMAQTAAAHNQPHTLAWILARGAFWQTGTGPDRVLDGMDQLLRISASDAVRDAIIAGIADNWAHMRSHPDAPDPRKRHNPALWAIGCIRLGWAAPTHSRLPLYASVCAKAASSGHSAMALMQGLGDWTDWVGLGITQAETKLGDLVGHTPPWPSVRP